MSRPERGRRQVGGWFAARGLKGVKGCPEGHGGALRGPGGLGEPCARGPERRGSVVPAAAQSGPAGTRAAWSPLRSIRSRRGSALCARGRAGRVGSPPGSRGAESGAGAAGGRRQAHSPSLAFFFLASVPPSLPRNDSSFFILWGRRAGERRGAEDMGTHGDPGGRAGSSASGSRPGRLRRRRRPLAPGSGREGAAPAPAPAPRPPLAPAASAARGLALGHHVQPARAVGGSHAPRHAYSPSAAVVPLLNAASRTDRVPSAPLLFYSFEPWTLVTLPGRRGRGWGVNEAARATTFAQPWHIR